MKRILISMLVLGAVTTSSVQAQNNIIVNADQGEYTISEHIYGQFAEHLGRGIYEGIWVGPDSDIPNTEGYRTDVLTALKELEIPNVRWPGGCFADEYDWRDGIGPRADRPKRLNTHWGGVIEDNSFGTHEFLRFAELIGAEPYISANVGSGTPAEMQDWIEYMTSDSESTLAEERRANGREEPWKIKFFGIGNESWGCGGNMTAEYFSNLYKQFATYAKNYSGNRLFKIASGFQNEEYDWTETMMKNASWMMDGLSLHYYTVAGDDGWPDKGPSFDFGEDWYYGGMKAALRLDEFVTKHSNRMDKYDPNKRVTLAVDEWGIWTLPLEGTNGGFLEQQNSMRDALIASVSLDILNSHADRVRIANIAQMVNVLQAMIITDGPKMIITPTYYAFQMYNVHHNATLLPVSAKVGTYTYTDERSGRKDLGIEIPVISSTVSEKDGVLNFTVTNVDPNKAQEVSFDIRGKEVKSIVSGSAKILTAKAVDSINTFDEPNNVKPAAFNGATLKKGILTLKLPPHSLVVLSVK